MTFSIELLTSETKPYILSLNQYITLTTMNQVLKTKIYLLRNYNPASVFVGKDRITFDINLNKDYSLPSGPWEWSKSINGVKVEAGLSLSEVVNFIKNYL